MKDNIKESELITSDDIESIIKHIEFDPLYKFNKIRCFQINKAVNTTSIFFVTSFSFYPYVQGFDKEFVDDIINECSLCGIKLIDYSLFHYDGLFVKDKIIEFDEHDIIIMITLDK